MKIDFRSEKAQDGSIKYRFETDDCEFIEALYFIYNGGLKVLCLSTQIGCDMKCSFCNTGKFKRKRNLTQTEITQQAKLIVNDVIPGERPDTITLAGMGEPLANYDASLGALEEFREIYGDIRLSLSTVGLKSGIKRMIHEKRSFGLYLSLHAADNNVRKKIIPISEQNSIEELFQCISKYNEINKKGLVRISYLLLKNINDSSDQLKKLISLVKDKDFIIQLRILNKINTIGIKKTSKSITEKWLDELLENNINAVIRPSMGGEINGGCGQLYEEKQ